MSLIPLNIISSYFFISFFSKKKFGCFPDSAIIPSNLVNPTCFIPDFDARSAKLGKSTITLIFVFVFAVTGRISF